MIQVILMAMLPMVVVIVMMKILVPKLKATIMVWNWWNLLICAKSYPSNYDNIPIPRSPCWTWKGLACYDWGWTGDHDNDSDMWRANDNNNDIDRDGMWHRTCGMPMTMTMTGMWCYIGHVTCHDNEKDRYVTKPHQSSGPPINQSSLLIVPWRVTLRFVTIKNPELLQNYDNSDFRF